MIFSWFSGLGDGREGEASVRIMDSLNYLAFILYPFLTIIQVIELGNSLLITSPILYSTARVYLVKFPLAGAPVTHHFQGEQL